MFTNTRIPCCTFHILVDYDIEPGGGISVDLKGRIVFLVCDSDLLLFLVPCYCIYMYRFKR